MPPPTVRSPVGSRSRCQAADGYLEADENCCKNIGTSVQPAGKTDALAKTASESDAGTDPQIGRGPGAAG